MPTVAFLAWRIVINHAVLDKFLARWSASCLLLSRSFMFRFWFTTVMFHHASLQVYYCRRSASCLLHVTFVSLQYYCLSFIIMYLFFFLPVYYCVIFLFDTVILSKQGSLLFTTRMSLYTKQNDPCHCYLILLPQQIFLLLRSTYHIFTTFS